MPTTCEFVFDRSTPIYYNGDQVGGNIVLITTKRFKLEGILINCKGYAQVNWCDEAPKIAQIEYNAYNDAANDICVTYEGQNVYIDEYVTQCKCINLQAGRHEYAFKFNLPIKCPATYAHKLGNISYSIKLILKRRETFDKIFEQRFVVKNRLNLHREKHKYLACSAESPLRMAIGVIQFSTPLTGYVPGQTIPYRLNLQTHNNEPKICKFNINLCQRYTYRCQQPTKQSREMIRKVATTKGIFTETNNNNDEGYLRVPLLSPITSIDLNDIISVSYYLEAVIVNKQKLILTKVTIPITVGTVSLRNEKIDSHFGLENLSPFCYDNLHVYDCSMENAICNKGYNNILDSSDNANNISHSNLLNESKSLLSTQVDRKRNPYFSHLLHNVCMQLFFIL